MPRCRRPACHSVTVTHPAAFRAYLLDQLKPLIQDFNVTVEVGMSDRNIPILCDRTGRRAGRHRRDRRRAGAGIPSTDLSAATDDIADGLCDWEHADPYPLALFDGARVDFSLRRLVHYTGSDWRHVQPWILLTNYHRYVDQFIRHGLDML